MDPLHKRMLVLFEEKYNNKPEVLKLFNTSLNNNIVLRKEMKYMKEVIHLHENDEAPSGLRLKYKSLKLKFKKLTEENNQLQNRLEK